MSGVEAINLDSAQSLAGEDGSSVAGPAKADAFSVALAQSAPSQTAQRNRFADGAISLSSYNHVVWTTPSDAPASQFGPNRQTFSNWLNSPDPVPQTAEATRQFMSHTDMNCWQWTTLAALRSGAIDRNTARSYSAGVEGASSTDAKLKALYGSNRWHNIDVAYTKVNGQWQVGRIAGQDQAKKGDIISFNGTDHVMTVTGRDAQGRLLVASFPTVIYGSTTDQAGPANPYAGTLEGFLQANLNTWNMNNDGNNFLGDHIRVGTPGFMNPQ